MMKRANLGCGAIQPEGWDNADLPHHNAYVDLDILNPQQYSPFPASTNIWGLVATAASRGDREPLSLVDYDYIVAHCFLSEFDHHQLPTVIANVRKMLKPGGVFRGSVPDLQQGMRAWYAGDSAWFPQDDRIVGPDARFCTWVTWFGTSRSVFTAPYLLGLLQEGGFDRVSAFYNRDGQTHTSCPDIEIVSLDTRVDECLFFEAST